jgi:hypothetical protein
MDVDQGWLLPSPRQECVPPGHMARFMRDTVQEALGLSAPFDALPRDARQPHDKWRRRRPCIDRPVLRKVELRL